MAVRGVPLWSIPSFAIVWEILRIFSGLTLEVASSKMTMGASFKIARAMEILCFSTVR